ncbi:MAG: NAD(P)-dependent oxidoreductase [Deltaproteobacteria bacterium]|nr:NAD(P)-dependent oxidoreductase [Deltaproteobacteria bacterium]
MRFFVTGATGFIGHHLCHALCEAGHEVTALVRSPEKAGALPSAARIHEGDLSLFARPDATLPEVDVVIHLAGIVAAPTPDVYDAINHRAVRELLACLGRQTWTPKRLLFASSLAAAGPSSRDEPWREADPLAPVDPYGEAKAHAEAAVAEAPFPTTTFRPCIVLGPDDPASLTLFRAAASGAGIRVAGDPQRLSFVDVRDVVSALVCMAGDTREGHFIYYVSHPDPIDIRILWRGLSQAVGKRVLVVPIPKPVLWGAMKLATLASRVVPFTNQLDVKQYAQMVAPAFLCSSEALRTELRWQPQHGLDDCLAHAAAGYRLSGLLAGGRG